MAKINSKTEKKSVAVNKAIKAKDKIEPKIDELFEKFNALLVENGLHEFSIQEFKLKGNTVALNCPCGTERVLLPSGKIVEQCRQCPPA
ncbi:hypothetical protein [Chitinophaga filiformis]|uniref:Uncharacterized protein n=1 Tax=Chitinophaga filiformis TaxID=104663 RepID=A0A1G7M0J2_CHIFI|nr:hypothetical protein [Chitinophaga filiformis]SDF55166.1 hypothetical protein SAMN04488121_102246 [Chitinophaga filiformis]